MGRQCFDLHQAGTGPGRLSEHTVRLRRTLVVYEGQEGAAWCEATLWVVNAMINAMPATVTISSWVCLLDTLPRTYPMLDLLSAIGVWMSIF